MDDSPFPESFVSVDRAAFRLGVPIAWLRAEALAGRVPCLRVGRRLLMNREEVERVLLERAQLEMTEREGQR